MFLEKFDLTGKVELFPERKTNESADWTLINSNTLLVRIMNLGDGSGVTSIGDVTPDVELAAKNYLMVFYFRS